MRGWFDAMEREDDAGTLALMTPDVVFVPVRTASRRVYHGHAGMAEFLAEIRRRHGHAGFVYALESVVETADGRTVSAGAFSELGIEFVALHEFDATGRIATARHYLATSVETLEQIGRV